jgi:hypothetical protein
LFPALQSLFEKQLLRIGPAERRRNGVPHLRLFVLFGCIRKFLPSARLSRQRGGDVEDRGQCRGQYRKQLREQRLQSGASLQTRMKCVAWNSIFSSEEWIARGSGAAARVNQCAWEGAGDLYAAAAIRRGGGERGLAARENSRELRDAKRGVSSPDNGRDVSAGNTNAIGETSGRSVGWQQDIVQAVSPPMLWPQSSATSGEAGALWC